MSNYNTTMITDNDILKIFKGKSFNEKHLNVFEKEYLINRYDNVTSLKESYWRILYNIEKTPICPICGKPLKFIGRKHRIYDKTCSKECAYQLKAKKLQAQYGENITNIFLLLHIKEKSKQTCLKRYGTEYALLSELIKEKLKLTLLERYGVENIFLDETVKQNIYNNNKEKFGNGNITLNKEISEKIKQTRIKNNSYKLSEETKLKISETLRSLNLHHLVTPEQIEKQKQTCLERYGETSYSKTKQFKEYFSSCEYQESLLLKKKQNKTVNSSSTELTAFNLLKEKYPSVISLYRSKLYPFNCDFYIPEIDTYIECNFHWTHGGHEFNKDNISDIEKLSIWENKAETSTYYKQAIKNWTVNDKLKIQTAIENNLNYFYPYTMKEFKKMLNFL